MAEQYGAFREIDHEPTGIEAGLLVQECLRKIDELVNARGASIRTGTVVIIKPVAPGFSAGTWTVAVRCDVDEPVERSDDETWDAGCRTD